MIGQTKSQSSTKTPLQFDPPLVESHVILSQVNIKKKKSTDLFLSMKKARKLIVSNIKDVWRWKSESEENKMKDSFIKS